VSAEPAMAPIGAGAGERWSIAVSGRKRAARDEGRQ
jgi:hypothetical protein